MKFCFGMAAVILALAYASHLERRDSDIAVIEKRVSALEARK